MSRGCPGRSGKARKDLKHAEAELIEARELEHRAEDDIRKAEKEIEEAVQTYIFFVGKEKFWTDGDLRLASGREPQNTAANVIPETSLTGLWFSWHVRDNWNPNRDNLLTWVACIADRLRKLQ